MMAMADPTKKPQPGRRRATALRRRTASSGGPRSRDWLRDFLIGAGARGCQFEGVPPTSRQGGRAGGDSARSPSTSESASPATPSRTSGKYIEAVVVVSLVVLRLQLDPDSRFARPQAHQLASLHPGPDGLYHPREDIPLPAHLHLAHVECGDAGLEDRLHPAHIHRGCAESRDEIGRTGAPRAAQCVDQRPNGARKICLPGVEARARWRRGSCQRWEQHHVT